MASQVAGYIGNINIGDGTSYSIGSTAYGYCETEAATAAKVVDMTGFKLVTGATIYVKFKEKNSASNPTLNVNGTGAKPIYRYGTTAIGSDASVNSWADNAVVSFTYDGNGWIEHYWYNNVYSLPTASNTTKGGVKIGDNLTMNGEVLSADIQTKNLYYVKGTQTAKTGAWTGNLPDIDALYEGLTIAYWLPFDGNGNATLNLTLSGGTTTGAINCYYGGSTRLTTHIPANYVCILVYQTVTVSGTSYTGWYLVKAYDTNTNDTARYLIYYNKQKAKSTVIKNRLCCGTASGFEHIVAGVTFDITYPIEYVTAAVAANAENYSGMYDRYQDINLYTALNIQTSDFTGIAGHYVYLVGTLSGKNFTVDSTTIITCQEPSTADGKYYMVLGKLGTDYTASLTNRFYLQEQHPIFVYQNGAFQPLDYVNTVSYVVGTQTAATSVWTGNLPEVSALYDGLIINYCLPVASTTTAVTLNLTLKGGTATGAVNVFYSGTTRMTNHYGAAAIVPLVYRTINISGTNYTGWWCLTDRDANTTDIVNLYEGAGNFVAQSALYRYQLIFQVNGNVFTPLNNNNNVTATTKTMLTNVEFMVNGKIYYYGSSTDVAANGAIGNACYYHRQSVDMRYTFNISNTAFIAHSYVYLKVTKQNNGKAKIASADPLVQSLPSSNDGYLYILLGRASSGYQMTLYTEHPIYYHDGTSIKEWRSDVVYQSYNETLYFI